MRVPSLAFLKSAPQAPRVVLLPDACFFCRNVPVEEGPQAAPIAAQIELVLETIAPFPLHQLNRGYFWLPGSREALVFAAYRRRFTQDQIQAWREAEWVAPSFCALLGLKPKVATTVLYSRDETLTAVSWGKTPVPSQVLVRPLPTDCSPEQLAQIKDGLLAELERPGKVLEIPQAPQAIPLNDEDKLGFEAGDLHVQLMRDEAERMDVRPAEDLDALRATHRRDALLWRSLLGMAAFLVFLAVAELALIGGKAWQEARRVQIQGQQPRVDRIMAAQQLAVRIDELATQRLLPFEMITVLTEKKPESIQFTRTTTQGLHSMKVEAHTGNISDIVAWKSALQAQAAIASVEVPPSEQQTSNNRTRFTLIAQFKPETLAKE